MSKKILIVTTNYSGCDCDEKNCDCIKDTGVWLEEFAVPYYIFKNAGFDIVVASPKGGVSPIDKSSVSKSNTTNINLVVDILNSTKKLSEIPIEDFDCIFFPGGHGPMFDLATNTELAKVVEYFYKKNKLISAICHGPAGLLLAKKEDGTSILNNKRLTSFTDTEEFISGLSKKVPFLLEKRLKELGADFIEEHPFTKHIEIDENLITGQNPQSSKLLAEKIVEVLCL